MDQRLVILLLFVIQGADIKLQKYVIKDISTFSYATTIGLAQFHEQVMNQVDLTAYEAKSGRPAKVSLVQNLISHQDVYAVLLGKNWQKGPPSSQIQIQISG
jgi:hypothetical protein